MSTNSEHVARADNNGARITAKDTTPWVPIRDGVSFRPLRFLKDDKAYVALLRLEPGVAIKLHRHTGLVHAYNLEGSRVLCTGERIGPGDYVYEPPGNTDTWAATDDGPLVVLIVVEGKVEYIGKDGKVTSQASCDTQLQAYLHHCAKSGIEALDLVE